MQDRAPCVLFTLRGICGIQLLGAIKVSKRVGGRRMAHPLEQVLIVLNPAGLSWYEVKTLHADHADLYHPVVFHCCLLFQILVFVNRKENVHWQQTLHVK